MCISQISTKDRHHFVFEKMSLVHIIFHFSFILVNSMAFEQDGCSICEKAKEELQHIRNKLKCQQKDKLVLNYLKQGCKNFPPVSDPIIFQVCSNITIVVQSICQCHSR